MIFFIFQNYQGIICQFFLYKQGIIISCNETYNIRQELIQNKFLISYNSDTFIYVM
jgi:hypothetical protein